MINVLTDILSVCKIYKKHTYLPETAGSENVRIICVCGWVTGR